MEDMNECAQEAALNCIILSERLRSSAEELAEIIPRVHAAWRGAAGEEFACVLQGIYRSAEFTERRLLELSEKIGQFTAL